VGIASTSVLFASVTESHLMTIIEAQAFTDCQGKQPSPALMPDLEGG